MLKTMLIRNDCKYWVDLKDEGMLEFKSPHQIDCPSSLPITHIYNFTLVYTSKFDTRLGDFLSQPIVFGLALRFCIRGSIGLVIKKYSLRYVTKKAMSNIVKEANPASRLLKPSTADTSTADTVLTVASDLGPNFSSTTRLRLGSRPEFVSFINFNAALTNASVSKQLSLLWNSVGKEWVLGLVMTSFVLPVALYGRYSRRRWGGVADGELTWPKRYQLGHKKLSDIVLEHAAANKDNGNRIYGAADNNIFIKTIPDNTSSSSPIVNVELIEQIYYYFCRCLLVAIAIYRLLCVLDFFLNRWFWKR